MDIIVIGGGASGMMAAGTAAKNGHTVTLIEKNEILGKKVLITGKGRCNITNACDDVETLINNVTKNKSFLYSAFYTFTNADTIKFFNDLGLETKVERGERVFPVSDKSSDIVDALKKYMRENGVKVIRETVTDIIVEDNKVKGVKIVGGKILYADKVIVATGGASYQRTGSTGDGYRWAESLGHTVVKPVPSLVPLKVQEDISGLEGLSLKNVAIKVMDGKKKIYEDFGEMMFAHFGLTGPVILSASAHTRPMDTGKYKIYLDLKPALDEKKLDERILRDFSQNINRDFRNSLGDLLPQRMIDTIIKLSEIDPFKKVNSITKEERRRLVSLIKNMEFTVVDYCPIEQAIITSGGISVKEIDSSTMMSKIVENLYFTGEIIDVDAYTGGFNLQIAFSTGYLAGISV